MRALLGIVLGLLLGAGLLALLSYSTREWTLDVRGEEDLLISGLVLLGVGVLVGVLIESRRVSRTSTLVASLLVAAIALPLILGQNGWWDPITPAYVEERLDALARSPITPLLAGLLLFATVFAPLRRRQKVDVEVQPAVAPGTATAAAPPPSRTFEGDPLARPPGMPLSGAGAGAGAAATGGLDVSPPTPSPPPSPVTNPSTTTPDRPTPTTSPSPPAPPPSSAPGRAGPTPAPAPGWSPPSTSPPSAPPSAPPGPRLPATPPPPGPPPTRSSGTWTAGDPGNDDPDAPRPGPPPAE